MNIPIDLKNMNRASVSDIERYLYSLVDDAKRTWMTRNTMTNYPLKCGSIPVLRAIARRIVALGETDAFLANSSNTSYDIVMLRGLVLVYADMEEHRRIAHIDDYLDMADSWAHIDTISCGIKYHDRVYYDWLVAECRRDDTWHVRYGIVSLMNNYFDDSTIEDALTAILNVKTHSYYIDMAIAWAVSVAYVRDRESTLKLIDSYIQPANIIRYAVGKVRDSYRVSATDKQYFRARMQRYLD